MEMHTQKNTEQSLNKAFSLLPTPKVPEVLAQRTIRKITHITKVTLYTWLFGWICSGAMTVYGSLLILQDIQRGEAFQYLSLLWTDTYMVTSQFFGEFAIMLLDTLPLWGMTVLLFGIYACIMSAAKGIRAVRLAI